MTSPTTQVNSSRSARENSSSSEFQSFALLIRRTVLPPGVPPRYFYLSSEGNTCITASPADPRFVGQLFLGLTLTRARWSNDYRRSFAGYDRVTVLKLRTSPPVAVDGACLPVGHSHPDHRLAAGFPSGLVARRNPDAAPRLSCGMAGIAPGLSTPAACGTQAQGGSSDHVSLAGRLCHNPRCLFPPAVKSAVRQSGPVVMAGVADRMIASPHSATGTS